MNRGQFLVLWIGIGVAIAMCLFPPQMEVEASRGEDGRAKIFVESAGYDFIFADNAYVLNVPTLGLQLGVVVAITWALFVSLKGTDRSKLSYMDKLILAKRKAKKSRM